MEQSKRFNNISLKIADFKGFGEVFTGFDVIRPINIIIGRNNTGKSALIDAIELCTTKGDSFIPLKHARNGNNFRMYVRQILDEPTLARVFNKNHAGNGVPGATHWEFGSQFIGRPIERQFSPPNWSAQLYQFNGFNSIQGDRQQFIGELLAHLPWPFEGMRLLRIAAERDVKPEGRSPDRTMSDNGNGTTNLVRSFINSDDLPRDEVEVKLLSELNEIYQGDSYFCNITCREDKNQVWEIFLREQSEGDIRLSQSGSSLKTIIMILCLLRLIPLTSKVNWEDTFIAIEEPENNLHPALLRRLLNFIAERREELGFSLIVTTHSPVGIDWSSSRTDCQILHVQNIDGVSTVRTAIGYVASRYILDDLDIRASDLLQANGVIWVEGPSDKIYLNRWLDLFTDGFLKEGVHYTTMFYGGKVLSHFDGVAPTDKSALVSLLSLNRNAALLMDSDRHLGGGKPLKSGRVRQPRLKINGTKDRIKAELESLGGLVWITDGREVENYLPGSVLSKLSSGKLSSLGKYDDVLSNAHISSFKENKVAFAHAAASHLTAVNLKGCLDIWKRLAELSAAIRIWNGLK
jgi:hypothetical protein